METRRRAFDGQPTPEPPSSDPAYYADIFRRHNLTGGHVFIHGDGNEEAAKRALETWPGGLAIAGDVTDGTAEKWLAAGARKVIVRSWMFPDGRFSEDRLRRLAERVGTDRLVVDLSCRKVAAERWMVTLNAWKTLTDTAVDEDTIMMLSSYASEIMVHPADETGKQAGIDERLVRNLAKWSTVPVTYAGGARSIEDLVLVDRASEGEMDLVIGSALDIYAGNGVTLAEVVRWNKEHGQDVRDVDVDGPSEEKPVEKPVEKPEAPETRPAVDALRAKLIRTKTEVDKVAAQARAVSRPVGDYCAICGAVFNLFWPRYECPQCGRFACHDHSTHKVRLRLNYIANEPLRVCDICFLEVQE